MIHRDIKPENIMMKGENSTQIYILDFGLAEFINDSNVIFKRSGTPGYVAPEILKD